MVRKINFKLKYFFYIIACILATLASVKVSYLSGDVVNKINERILLENLGIFILSIVGWIVLWNILLTMKNILKYKITQDYLEKSRKLAVRNILKEPLKLFKDNSAAFYHNLLANDFETIRLNYTLSKLIILDNSILLAGSLVFMFRINPIFPFLAIVSTIIPYSLPKLSEKRLNSAREGHSNKQSNFLEYVKESILGISVVRDFALEGGTVERFNLHSKELEGAQNKLARISNFVDSSSIFTSFFMYATILSLGVYLNIKGFISVGEILIASQLTNYIRNPIIEIVVNRSDMNSTKSIRKKIRPYLKKESQKLKEERLPFSKAIKVKDLSFSYDGDVDVLKNVSLDLKKNKKYLILGQSGSGKSTFMKLLMRYFDNYNGDLFIDDLNLKNVTSEQWYQTMTPILQDTFVFEKPLYFNIALSNDYNEENMLTSLDKAGLKHFLSRLDEGINTVISEGAKNISGGEKQRIAIARALYKDSDIIFCDEAFSSLDYQTQHAIEKTLLRLEEKTIIIISHSINQDLLENYDNFILFEQGEAIMLKDLALAKEMMKARGLL